MTELKGSRFTALLPEHLAYDLSVQAMAYAVGRQVEAICGYADKTGIYAAIALLPEAALDLLALELRTPAYDEAYSAETKRRLVQNSILAFAKMGTPGAVENLAKAIFGSGVVEEWFEYDGEPHHFKVRTGRPTDVIASHERFAEELKSVKRASSWLDSIEYEGEEVIATAYGMTAQAESSMTASAVASEY